MKPLLIMCSCAALLTIISGCKTIETVSNPVSESRAEPLQAISAKSGHNDRNAAGMAHNEKTHGKMAQDRQAILAMQGNYKVSFNFKETVALKAGYALKAPKSSGAHEIVRLIRDDPGYISLQHILVVGSDEKHPVKHWRQDWIYEPDYIYTFVGFNSWKKQMLSPAERQGKWAQLVYQVDDSPRYAALSEWKHENGVSAWTSPPNMRPLPRRDMTIRDDYQAILAVNRHAITPDGWVHEQDNTKLILTGDNPQALVREVGVNHYQRFDDFAISIGEDYWADTQDYWSGVRDIWTGIQNKNSAFGLTLQGETTALYMALMDMTDKIDAKDLTVEEAVQEAGSIIELYTTTDIESSIANAKSSARQLDNDAY